MGFKVAAPDGPLKSYFEQEDTKQIFYNLLCDATIDALAKMNENIEGKEVGAKCSVLNTIAVTKPPRRIWVINLKELELYVPYQKFPPGNKHWRLKLALDYLFKKKKLDSNTFAVEIPEDNEPQKFNLEKLLVQ